MHGCHVLPHLGHHVIVLLQYGLVAVAIVREHVPLPVVAAKQLALAPAVGAVVRNCPGQGARVVVLVGLLVRPLQDLLASAVIACRGSTSISRPWLLLDTRPLVHMRSIYSRRVRALSARRTPAVIMAVLKGCSC